MKNKRWFLLTGYLFFYLISFSQEESGGYLKYINYDSSFVSICTKMESLFETEKMEISDPESFDNDYIKFKRWESYWEQRLTSDGKLPKNELLDHTIQLKNNLKMGLDQQNKNLVVWEFKGPEANTGGYWGAGRVTDIAFHPTDENVFFVSTAKGGIWKTTDGGNSYFSIGDDLPYNSVGNIVINKNNPNEIFITLGDNYQWTDSGLGVYKTIDGGATWFPTQLVYSLSNNVTFYEMKGSPLVDHLIFVSTGSGVFRSVDGDNFSLVTTGLPNAINSGSTPAQIAFHPTDSSIVYLAWWDYTGGDTDLFKSTDAGLTWANVTNLAFTEYGYDGVSIATTIENPNKVIIQAVNGTNKKIGVSYDSGDTWIFQPDNNLLETSPICISPTNENLIYSGSFYIKRSLDNGNTFENFAAWDLNFVHVDQHVIAMNPLNNKIYWGNDGGVYSYIENGEQWMELNNNLCIRQIYSSSVGQVNDNVYFFGSQDNGSGYYNQISGWINAVGGDAMDNAIDPTDDKIGFSSSALGGTFARTLDGWNSYVMVTNNIPGYAWNADWLAPFDMATDTTLNLVIASDEIYLTKDRGDNWNMLTNGETGGNKIKDIRFSPSNWKSIYSIISDKVIESNNGGISWTVHDFGSNNLTKVITHPTNEDKLWVIKSGYTSGQKIFFSIDRGETFVNITENLPNIPVLCLIYDSVNNMIFIGTELGVYTSKADIIVWEPYGQGLPNTAVTDLDIQNSTRSLVASTYGRGIWRIGISKLYNQASDHYNESSDLSELTVSTDLKLYPNPVEKELTVSFSSVLDGDIFIYNVNGQKVTSVKINGTAFVLNLDQFTSGIYTIYIRDKRSGRIYGRKFIKS